MSTATLSPDTRPNIVLILADDMGYSDIGCFGSEIATPNLDRLAAEGVRFTQFYNTARCCPSRASLLTGLHPHQAGVGHMVGDHGVPAYRGYLNDRCVTLAEVLRAAGYHTLMSGKWHVGEHRPHWPVDRGFEHHFGLISGASSYFRLDGARQMAVDDQPYVPEGDGFYMTDAFTDHAVGFIEDYAPRPEPFFLYLGYTAPHWPLHAHPADIARYRGRYRDGWDAMRIERQRRMTDLGILNPDWALTPRDPKAPAWSDAEDKDLLDLKMAVYAAQVDRMDQGIGRILDALAGTGAAENTLVLFLSDNGGCAEEIHRGTPGVPPGEPDSFMSYGLPWANASNAPFRLYKHWVHEGGIATPLIARWPEGIRARGALTHEPAQLTDVMATVVDVTGASYPEVFDGRPVTPMEGISLRGILDGGTRDEEAPLFWEHEGNRAARRGRWKLVSRHPGAWELYDLEADRTETTDLANRHPGARDELIAAYERWAARCGVVPWAELPPTRR